ncbi:MAG: cupin domain-containing protein [Streptosporangiaceae bacterium]
MSRHVGAEILARFREGTLHPRRAARIESHLARCDRCAATDAGLADVSGLLASAAPAPMPDQVTDRLSAVLAAESASRQASGSHRVGAPDAVSHPGREAGPARPREAGPARPREAGDTGRPTRHSRRMGRRLSSPVLLRGLAAAGALAVVIVVGVVLTRGPSTGTSASSGSSTAPANPHAAIRHAEAARIDYSRSGKPAVTTAVASGANLTAASLPGEISSLLPPAGSAAGANSTIYGSDSPAATTGPATVGGVDVAQLSGCVSRVSDGRQVLLVEVARYQGARAVIIVMRSAPAGPDLEVVVAGTGCSASATHVIATTRTPAG